MMDELSISNVEERLAARLHGLRSERGLTLDALAERSGVSLASLFAEEERKDAAPLARRADQRVWRDPDTRYVRRNLSPPGFPSAIELVEVLLPPKAHVTYESPLRAPAIDQQVWALDGALQLTVGETTHDLAAGDCLAMRVDQVTAFRNPTRRPARYLVALTMVARRAHS